ncbi:hypothetical protein PRVXT_001237 [Proteinivorax tanatarense]|uniref:DUF4340 domain-containing protein n=1 Tax=Proteinivorax tanatarense TaxID=1260629 RepID=A0AAU7VPE7_9FIRM
MKNKGIYVAVSLIFAVFILGVIFIGLWPGDTDQENAEDEYRSTDEPVKTTELDQKDSQSSDTDNQDVDEEVNEEGEKSVKTTNESDVAKSSDKSANPDSLGELLGVKSSDIEFYDNALSVVKGKDLTLDVTYSEHNQRTLKQLIEDSLNMQAEYIDGTITEEGPYYNLLVFYEDRAYTVIIYEKYLLIIHPNSYFGIDIYSMKEKDLHQIINTYDFKWMSRG